jgi:parallel beta-helix repeat protein
VNKSVSIVGESRGSTIVDGRPFGGNVFYVNGTGGGSRVSIENLTIVGSGTSGDHSGIRVVSSNDNNISRNSLMGNSNGITLVFSRNNRVSNNQATSNAYTGLHLSSSGDNLVSHNNISGSQVGIYLESSNNNNVTGNVITTNVEGIDIGYGYGNTIYHNNLDNANINAQAWPANVTNDWDHDGEGNYWQDYKGHDVNGDGIGETSYHVPTSGGTHDQDRYPLMGQFSVFAISFEGTEYEASLISNSTISSFRFELGGETANRMMRFTVSGVYGSVGFCRLAIPNGLMPSPHVVLIDSEEIVPKQLNVSSAAYASIYFTFLNENQTVTVIYSESLHLYYELLGNYLKLQSDFAVLNETYYALLYNYTFLSGNLSQTQQRFDALKTSYNELYRLNQNLNSTCTMLLSNYEALLESYGELQLNFGVLSANYSKLQSARAEQAQNMRNLLYISAATTALLIVTTVYLSKKAHSSKPPKARLD